ncbi:Ig-like domain-containing protein [Pseudoflavitalea rhizosphaerae]|uniref:Ig-like domain-containing protein n=1 Tax=Pseudoflavitalea rhizosphaerae TaxID=1884793 RepID=UPI000F8D73B9|nr:Ig-like domain-containing protein [Pseudoflavitalea rhizosphaerae]
MKKLILAGITAAILAHACSNIETGAAADSTISGQQHIPFDQLPVTHSSFVVDGTTNYVNVMGNQRKTIPAFPAVPKKKGWAVGYVKDSYGKPVPGAVIGVRASAYGGFTSGSSAVTNEKGYYEVMIPWGVADFYAAAAMVHYEGGSISMSLFPADSSLGSFPGPAGIVKNWVLLPYGPCNRARVASQPHLPSNYFGASISIEYASYEKGDFFAQPEQFERDSELEIKLTPQDLMHAAEKRSFTIRKTVYFNSLNILNIPVGKYKIEARKLPGGEPLKLKSTFYNPRPEYGMQPSEATGSAMVTFIPKSSDASTTVPFFGNWEDVRILISR